MPRPATDLRARVLGAARTAFDGRGFDGTSLRAIARGARTTIGMIYYYFPTKDALWDGVIDDVYQRFLRDSADPEERQYTDPADEINANLVHANYMSAADLAVCREFSVEALAAEAGFIEMQVLHDALSSSRLPEEDVDAAA